MLLIDSDSNVNTDFETTYLDALSKNLKKHLDYDMMIILYNDFN